MKARNVAVVGVAAAAGAAALGAHHLRDAPANMRRYSMPSVGAYDLVTRLIFRRRYDEIAAAIATEASEGATVVDLGSGTGQVLVRLATLAPSLELTGVDVDPEMVARARAKAERAIPPSGRRPTFVEADAGALPFPDASVDLLVSSYAVHHIPDRHAARAEIMRVLKPGGRAIIWDVGSPHGAPGSDPQATPAAHQEPAQHAVGAIDIARMLVTFARLPAERYELRKPA